MNETISPKKVPAEIFTLLRNIESYLDQSGLDAGLMTMVKLRVSQLNGCAYCVDMHVKEWMKTTPCDPKVHALCVWEESKLFSELERDVLRFSEATTTLSGPVLSAVLDPLKKYYNTDEICQWTLAVAQINTWNRLMKTWGFEPNNT